MRAIGEIILAQTYIILERLQSSRQGLSKTFQEKKRKKSVHWFVLDSANMKRKVFLSLQNNPRC